VKYKLRMYFLDAVRVPQKSFFFWTHARCLSITVNMAIRKRMYFKFYAGWTIAQKNQFEICFEKQLGFHQKSDIRTKICMLDKDTTNMFFRLLFATWEKIYHDNIVNSEPGPDENDNHEFFLKTTDVYATNNEYLLHEPDTVTNQDIVSFVHKCMKTSLFVASAYGFKSVYGCTPKGYVDICDGGALTLFAQKATCMISKNILDNFNTESFPDYLQHNLRFGHIHCPIIYGFDIGYEITPLQENMSLIPNGYSGRKYLKELLGVNSIETRAQLDLFNPTRKCVTIFLLSFRLHNTMIESFHSTVL
jgi:hypothetical protein